jgi:hypothetical protein
MVHGYVCTRCKGRLAVPKGEGESEGCSMLLVCKPANPSPQFSPLAKGRGGTTGELRPNEQYHCPRLPHVSGLAVNGASW